MSLLDFGTPEPRVLRAESYPSDLEDDAGAHRWRAQWSTEHDGTVRGIDLTAYPVVKLTPQGAWIDPHAYRQWEAGGQVWHLTGSKRWVSNTGGAAWAKPKKDEALHSIAVRLHRWAQRLHSDNVKLRQAAEALKVLRPNDGYYANRALETINIARYE